MVTTRRGEDISSPAPTDQLPGKLKWPAPTVSEDGTEFTAKTFLYLFVPFVVFVTYIGALFYTMPHMEKATRDAVIDAVRPPLSLKDAVVMRDVLSDYAKENEFHVALVVSSVYVFAQCFAVPGTLTLSLLCGALFGFYKGLAMVMAVNLTGSSLCYWVNTKVGRSLAFRIWPAKVRAFKREVEKRRANMVNYIFFLRVTPFLPNTFINVASPVVHVPYYAFAIGTVTGTFPNNFIAVKAGMKLSEMASVSELYDPQTLALFVGLGFLVLLPALLTSPPDFSSQEEDSKQIEEKSK